MPFKPENVGPWLNLGLEVAPSLILDHFLGESAETQAKLEQSIANFEADQLMDNARARLAAGTRAAYERRRAGRITASNAAAAMGASGGVADDAGAARTLARIDRDAEYNSLSELYQATREARGTEKQARARRFEGGMARVRGRNEKRAARIGMVNSLVSKSQRIADLWDTKPLWKK